MVVNNSTQSARSAKVRKSKPRRAKQAGREPRFTLKEAFSPFLEPDAAKDPSGPEGDLRRTHLNLERSIRAAALLIEVVTQGGNRPLHEEAAIGLGRVLQICAGEIARVEKLRRVSSSPQRFILR